MTEIETKAKKWGNSMGVRIPKEVVEKEEIKPDDKIIIDVIKLKKPEKNAYGTLKDWKLDPQKAKEEMREEHAS